MGKLLSLNHSPSLEEMLCVVVVIAADADKSLAKSRHLIADVRCVVEIGGTECRAVGDLKAANTFKLRVESVVVKRPEWVVVYYEKSCFNC